MPKLIVFAHGIGDTKEGFEKEWRDAVDWKTIIGKNFEDQSDIVVKGLWWEDVLQKVEDKYPLVDDTMADVVAKIGFPAFKTWVGGDSWKTFNDYFMDVLVYAGLPNMWQYIQNKCALKLAELQKDEKGTKVFNESDIILIGHSLGAAMMPHLAWREYTATGAIPYHGMILLASPLGFESPMPSICEDFLSRMGGMYGGPRNNTLMRFAREWNTRGDNRLRFIANENDIVCSKVVFTIPPGIPLDIPVKMYFNSNELDIMDQENNGCFESISFGKPDPSKIVDNHDAQTYIKSDAFKKALGGML